MGGIGLSSVKNCTVGRLVANPRASQQHDGSQVVEIGANRQSCEPSAGLLLKLVLEMVLCMSECQYAGRDRVPRLTGTAQGKVKT